MTLFRADLHCHTTCSDGTLSPEQILHLAKESGLSGISITDHDTIDAYQIATPLSQQLGLQLLTGVEFSTTFHDESIHVLGFGFSPQHPSITELCLKHKTRRLNRNLKMLELLAKHGMLIEESEILANRQTEGVIGRPHIAMAMIKHGFVTTIKQAFDNFIGEGKSCYVAGEMFSLEDTIHTIHQAGGLAVIAHPHLIKQRTLVNLLLAQNFDGIECYYGNFPPKVHEKWLKIAKQKNWLITGGSDFHGAIRPGISLGSSWIDKFHFDAISERIQSKISSRY